MELKKKMRQALAHLVNRVAQGQEHHNPIKTITPGMPERIRSVAAQGAVLLENRVLPFAHGTQVAVFGRVQLDWFCTGYGSGGDVNAPYSVNLLEGLRRCEALKVDERTASVYEQWGKENPADHGAWGMWPRCHPEMPVGANLVRIARQNSKAAVIVIGRSSGEDRENVLEPGSYYLTQEERSMLREVTAAFPDAVLVLNIGSVMDLSFLEEFSFGAVLLAWQGGMESGNAVADLLCGRQTPCGRLTDTIALRYEDQPSAACFGDRKANEYREDIYVGYRWFETFAREKVRYPFGYGLSYTTFALSTEALSSRSYRVTVTNTGNYSGREVVMLFVEKPCGALGNPARELVAFGKTGLLAPGERQELTLEASEYQLSSYDDSGLTGNKSCYVLMAGEYRFYCGENVRSAAQVGAFTQEKARVLRELTENGAPQKAFPVVARENGERITRQSPKSTVDLKKRIQESLPRETFITGDRGYKLRDVQRGKISLDTFVAQLDLEELEAISRGGYSMEHPLGARGNAGIFGGVTQSLREKGVPVITTCDGPSGLRLYDACSLIPIGTLLASTFDVALVEELTSALGRELRDRSADVILAPGMNIHRNPLCGRNFEYFSEDPYLTGKMAGAYVRGIQSQGGSACPKHFACNNQETNRLYADTIVTERALREIYLKGFEICVKEATPKTLMTSYNKINGVWGHYHYALVKGILRDEWGYQGNVITDWWMRYAPSPEFPGVKGNGYRVRSRVDVLMPGSRSFGDKRRKSDGTLLASYGKAGGITLGELQEAARNVLRCAMAVKQL